MSLPARLVLVLVACFMASPAVAGLPECTAAIAEQYELPVGSLEAIHEQEGGYTGARVRSPDGSFDRGLMQINTFWDGPLSAFGITPEQVRYDDCINVAVAAWILRTELNRFKNFPDAFAAYNAGAGRLKYGRDYARKVMRIWRTAKSVVTR